MDPAPILTMADAVRRACELIPSASTVVEEHIAGLDEVAMSETTGGVLPYSFFTELRLFVFADGGDPVKIAGLFELAEATLASPDDVVRGGSLIRIAHKLHRHEADIARLGVVPGPRLREAMH